MKLGIIESASCCCDAAVEPHADTDGGHYTSHTKFAARVRQVDWVVARISIEIGVLGDAGG